MAYLAPSLHGNITTKYPDTEVNLWKAVALRLNFKMSVFDPKYGVQNDQSRYS